MSARSQIALITGGSRGLGRSTAEVLAHRGVASIITYNTNRGAAHEVVAGIQRAGVRAVALQLDTGNTGAFAAFADQVRRFWAIEAPTASISSSTTPAPPTPAPSPR